MKKKVIFLKTGAYAFHPVYGPVMRCVEGGEDVISSEQADALEADGWAETVEVMKGAEPSVPVSDPETDDEDNTDQGPNDQDDEDRDDEGGNTSPEGPTDADRIPPWLREGWADLELTVAKKALQDWSILIFEEDLVDMRKGLPKIITRLEKALEA